MIEEAAKYVVPTATWTWNNRSKIQKAVATVRRWIAKKSRILIVGAGGTGKSTLAHLLTGEFDWLHDNPWEYRADTTSKVIDTHAKLNAEALILPGQKARREREWPKILEELSKGKFSGVIFVSANGYLTPPGGTVKKMMEQTRAATALEKYLEHEREAELELLRQIVPALKAFPKKLWLLSVVTKEDLWCDDHESVWRNFCEGEYNSVVAEVAVAKSPSMFAHELVLTSLLIANFRDADGSILQKSAAGYDHERQVSSFRTLLEVLHSLKDWEKRR